MDFTWNDELSVSNETIDQQHKHLLSLFERTHTLLEEKVKTIEMLEIVSELVVYAKFHFKEEELLMAENNYKGLDAHLVEHQDFISKVDTIKNNIGKDPNKINKEIFTFLAEWIMTHIQVTDQAYKGFI